MEISDTLLVALIGLLAALIGAAVGGVVSLISTRMSNNATEKRMKTELEKWYAGHFMSRKVETLSNLYSSLVASRLAIYGPEPHYTIDNPKEILRLDNAINKFEIDLTQATAYLRKDERDILRIYKKQFQLYRFHYLDVIDAFSKDERPPPYDVEPFDVATKDAYDLMERLLSPGLVTGNSGEE